MGSRRHRAHRVACDVEFVTAHIVRDSGEGLGVPPGIVNVTVLSGWFS